jgi:DNA-binding MltR family transcriptional regulator
MPSGKGVYLVGESDISTAADKVKKAFTFRKMAGSGIVLSMAAILDNTLERVLRKTLKPLPNKLYKRLFESFGPLGSFSNKILMARALGIITNEIYQELEKIREIRNIFAHSNARQSFGLRPDGYVRIDQRSAADSTGSQDVSLVEH